MGTIDEIAALEEGLRLAELGPAGEYFEEALADDAVFLSSGEEPSFSKAIVVDAHRPGGAAKFTRVEMTNTQVVDHGSAAVVTCDGTYETADSNFRLRFMRVWLKTDGRWQVIAATVSPLDDE